MPIDLLDYYYIVLKNVACIKVISKLFLNKIFESSYWTLGN